MSVTVTAPTQSATLCQAYLSRYRSDRRGAAILLCSGLSGFATDIFQLITGMFHLTPHRANIPAQLFDRAYKLLRRFP